MAMDKQEYYEYRAQFNKDKYKPPSIYPSPQINEKWHQAWEEWKQDVLKSGWTGDKRRTKFSSFLQLCINTQLGIVTKGSEGLPEIKPIDCGEMKPVDDDGLDNVELNEDAESLENSESKEDDSNDT